jgi:Tfp pilus assembly protein PilO
MRGRFVSVKNSVRAGLAVAAAIVTIGLIVHFFVLVPVRAEIQRLNQQIAQKQEDLKNLVHIRQAYTQLREGLERIEPRLLPGKSGASLLGTIEDLAARLQIRERITHMRPQPDTVAGGFRESAAELKLEAIKFEEVLNFLVAIEEAPYLLRIRQFHLKARFPSPDLYDLTLTLTAYEPVAQGAPESRQNHGPS